MPLGHVKATLPRTLGDAAWPGPPCSGRPGQAVPVRPSRSGRPGQVVPGAPQRGRELVRVEVTADRIADLQAAGDEVDLAFVQTVNRAAQSLVRLHGDDHGPPAGDVR